MEDIFEIALELVKWVVKTLSYLFVEILFEYIFFNTGYYTLKILTLTSFPKNRVEAEKSHTEIAVFGIFVWIVLIVIVGKKVL